MAKLFAQEVPEIYDGIIEIKAVVAVPASAQFAAPASSEPKSVGWLERSTSRGVIETRRIVTGPANRAPAVRARSSMSGDPVGTPTRPELGEAVAAAIKALELPLVVVDPVMVSKSGAYLLDDDGVLMLRTELLPCAAVVTPNIPEAEILSGRRTEPIEDARARGGRFGYVAGNCL